MNRQSRTGQSADRKDSRPMALALLAPGIAVSTATLADVIIPATGSIALAGGEIHAGCTNLSIAGVMSLDTGRLATLRDITVQPGGALNGNSGAITLSGEFSVLTGATYSPGQASLSYDTLCKSSAVAAPIPAAGAEGLIALALAMVLLAAISLRNFKRRQNQHPGAPR